MKFDIQKIANLARLLLSDKEEKMYEQQLGQILQYMDILDEVDTSNVEATYQVTGLTGKERDDVVQHDDIHNIQKELLECSTFNDGKFIQLPPVL